LPIKAEEKHYPQVWYILIIYVTHLRSLSYYKSLEYNLDLFWFDLENQSFFFNNELPSHYSDTASKMALYSLIATLLRESFVVSHKTINFNNVTSIYHGWNTNITIS